MIVHVNGEARDVDEGTTVAGVVAGLGADATRRGVAVAVDAEVVPRGQWGRPLREGERVEVVTAIQGG
ncbi:MAG: sulfur carrier protein ThiS [Actinomycetota bacterium]|nr:sulfur carrier protein ThiS [Actinomycetota bacterium]